MAKQSVLDKINAIRKSLFVDDRYHNYSHSVVLQGWLIASPIIRVAFNGKRVANFFVYQVNERGYKAFSCITYSEPIIKALLDTKQVCLINCLGLLTYSSKTRYNVQIEEIEITHLFEDIPLDPPYTEEEEND